MKSNLSLSFLDVMTCSLGGVLLLFFILVTLKQALDIDSRVVVESPGAERKSPFVIVIELDDDGSGPLALADRPFWEIEGLRHFEYETQVHESFAVLYADHPPFQSGRIVAKPATADCQLTYRVILNGQRKVLREGVRVPAPPSNQLSVWPIQGDR